ncbi:MAG: YidC/Oxa1 family membrane protein insertase [Flavobacteriales bacterium]|nr:YidC/Oxa1 family membrane protein insertase [Flavobacteriales bacterium]
MNTARVFMMAMFVFLGGTISFGQGGEKEKREMSREEFEKMTPEQKATKKTKHMTEELSLTPEQSEKMQALNLEHAKKMEVLRAEKKALREKMKAEKERMEKEMDAVLTPEQKELHEENVRKRKEKRKEHFKKKHCEENK